MGIVNRFQHEDVFRKREILLERPRVTRLLEDALKHPVITVCAGSGYGKTSALYSFLEDLSNAYSVWFWVSENDNVEASFWENYINSIYGASPELLKSLLHTGLPTTKKDYEKYFSFMRAAQPIIGDMPKYVIVYDDFHSIANPNVLRFIEGSIRAHVAKRTIIFLSRTDPTISLPYLTTIGDVPSITEEDLRFTESEITDYLKKLDVSISTQGAHDIFRDTQGWAFALSLIGRSLKKSPEYRSDIFGAVRNNVYRVFEIEIFSIISERLKNFLLRISLLGRFPLDLIKELDRDNDLITEMEQQSAYVRFDPYTNTYVIHHLLLSYLRDHQDILSAEEKKETYKTAGDYCTANGYRTDAINYYEKAGAYEALFNLVTGDLGLQMPPDLAEYLLEVFENISDEAVKTINIFPALHLRILVSLGRLTDVFRLGKLYEKQYLELPETEETTHTLAVIYMALGCARQLQSTFDGIYDFDDYFEKQYEYYNKNPYYLTSTSAILSSGSWGFCITNVSVSRKGDLEEYIAALERTESFTIRAQSGYGAGASDVAAGELRFYQNDMDGAELFLTRGLKTAKTRKQFDIMQKAIFYLMRIAFMRGDAPAAFKAHSDIKTLLSETTYPYRYTTHDITCGWYYISLGLLESVPEWLKSDFSPYAHAKFLENLGNHIKMGYCFAVKDYMAILNFTKLRKERETLLFERLETQIMEACVHYKMRNKSAALESLREAYETALPNQLVTPFIEMGKHMRTLTAAAIRTEDCLIPKAWLKSINRQASAYSKFQAYIVSEYNIQHYTKTGISLSDREKEILVNLSLGLSRTEIASNLGISHNTVKLMISHLYEKIGASNLADAIRIGLGEKWI